MTEYKTILLGLDNSAESCAAADFGLALAARMASQLVGCHVYSGALHDRRFGDMEPGLPPRYQTPEELAKQRNIHQELIGGGLVLISNAMIQPIAKRATELEIGFTEHILNGKNFAGLLESVRTNAADLVCLGAHGQGKTARSLLGSVPERLIRQVRCDVYVARGPQTLPPPLIVAAIDGSPQARLILERAVELAAMWEAPLKLVAVYDPRFHTKVFRNLATVLNDEENRVVKFKEQEALHDEIIDDGLRNLYRTILDNAASPIHERGLKVTTRLLEGKVFDALLEYAEQVPEALWLIGRFGQHRVPESDIGSNAECFIRQGSQNTLLVGGTPEIEAEAKPKYIPENPSGALRWTAEAEQALERIPVFVRGMVRRMIEKRARTEKVEEITADFVRASRPGGTG